MTASVSNVSSEILETIMTRTPHGLWLVDKDGRSAFMNRSMEALLGLKSAATNGRRLSDFLAPESRQEHALLMLNTCERENARMPPEASPLERLWTFLRTDGTPVRLEVFVTPCGSDTPRQGPAPAPRSSGLLLVAQYPRETAACEVQNACLKDELALLQRRFELATNNLRIGVWELDIKSGHLTWDATLHEIYGYAPGDFNGQVGAWQNCLCAEDKDLVDAAFSRLLAGEFIEPFEFRILRHSDQELRYLEADGLMQRDAQGLPWKVLGTNWDVTERKLQELALQSAKTEADSANLAKSQFLGHMSHEIRTPLAAIRGYAEILTLHAVHGATPSISPAKCIQQIEESSEQLEVLVNDILDLTRVESGKMHVNKVDFDLQALLEQVIAIFIPRAQAKGLRLLQICKNPMPKEIRTDPQRLRQILLNLIGNAIKFTKQGTVTVETSTEPIAERAGWVTLTIRVKDTGIGIAPESRSHLFQQFSQLDSATNRRYGGSGLGLWLSRNFARLLDGDVELEESQPLVGSVFVLRLVVQDVNDPEITKDDKNSGQGNGESVRDLCHTKPLAGQRLLVVDDAPELRLVIKNFLMFAGATVTLAEDGQEALDRCDQQEFDAILMDIQMPHVDGYSALRSLKSRRCLTPVIALTAHAMSGERAKCLAAGFSDYVTKPVRFREVIAAVLRTSSKTETSKIH